MSVAKKLNLKYAELCKQLGDLHFKRSCLDNQIADLVTKIKNLNELQPELLEALSDFEPSISSQRSGVPNNESGSIGQTNARDY